MRAQIADHTSAPSSYYTDLLPGMGVDHRSLMMLDKAFEKFGVEKFGEKGEDFDPTKHDAILHKPDPNAEKETVDTVVEAGYRIGDRVIRAARVVVASPQN